MLKYISLSIERISEVFLHILQEVKFVLALTQTFYNELIKMHFIVVKLKCVYLFLQACISKQQWFSGYCGKVQHKTTFF